MAKLSKAKIASSYADSISDLAFEQKLEDKVFNDFKILQKEVAINNDIVKYLTNPFCAIDDKKTFIENVANKFGFCSITQNALEVIVNHNRASCLKEILYDFEKKYYHHKNVVVVDVSSVMDLTIEQNDRLIKNLQKLTKKEVVINYKINPDILGGLLIELNSKLIDDSIKGKLDYIELMMKGAK